MKINRLAIDGYGVWTGLRVERLADGLSVLYGPNEAGKTTLLAFIRGVLYGFGPGQVRYLPPLRGGRPGGAAELLSPHGRFVLERHREPGPDGTVHEEVVVTAADGVRQGEPVLRLVLGNVDEAVFHNVFAVGLREMQELGTLSDSKAAELLYSLTAGLDRVSLVEVIRELEASRSRLLARDGGACEIGQLAAERARLRGEIERLSAGMRRYVRLAAERQQLDDEVARLEKEQTDVEQHARVVELAAALSERWQQREEIDQQLALLAPAAGLPEGAVERLDAIASRLAKHERRIDELAARRRHMKNEVASLGIHRGLWRQAARIEAMVEQSSWIESLEQNIGELQTEVTSLEGTLRREREAIGFSGGLPSDAPLRLPHQAVKRLRTPAAAVRAARERVEEARQHLTEFEQEAESLGREMQSAFAGRNEHELAGVIDQAGARVAQLRRRLLVDDRLDELTRYHADLEEQSRDHLQRQLLPVWVVAAFGGCFALGVVLVVAGLFVPASVTGSFGWAMTVLGLLGAGAAGFGKVLLERSNARQLEACQRQIVMIQAQIRQAEEERDSLDAQLPQGGGPMTARLQAAEQELAALEDLVPMRSKRDSARQRVEAAARRAAEAEGDLAAARRRWSESLAELGLPAKLSPRQVRRVVAQCEQHAELFRQLQRRREELALRRRELENLAARIRDLAAEAEIGSPDAQPVALLGQLDGALGRQRDRVERYRQLRREARQLRRRYRKHVEAMSRLKHERRALLLEAGVEEEQQLRELAVQAARAAVLRQQRDGLKREIDAAAAGTCPLDVLGKEIAAGDLDKRLDELLVRLDATENRLRESFERRGQTAEQLRTLADDRQLARRQLDLATVETRLQAAIRRWQVYAVASHVLDAIRIDYERDRQPETLLEASGYLARLTRGRYTRVWTPLGEDSLRVDDCEGNSLGVEMLSRGTREQLFLALRLALAASYARRGAPLPMVLDDVLVNFDAERAQAAGELLREFAEAGHQLLVFTCHEHVFELFRSLDVAAAQLPRNVEPNPPALLLTAPEKPRRRRAARPKPPAVVEPPIESPHDEAPVEIDASPIDDEIAPLEDAAMQSHEPEDVEEEPLEEADDADLWAEEDERAHPRHGDRVFDADFFSSEDEAADSADWPRAADDGFGWFEEEPDGEDDELEADAGEEQDEDDDEDDEYEDEESEDDEYDEDEWEEEPDDEDDLDDPARAA